MSIIFQVLAWLSLFIPPESVPGRVGMGMTTLLTLTAMFSSVRSSLCPTFLVSSSYYCQVRQNVPRISYISFLDIWMLICMLFVFSCILEFIIMTIFLRSGRKGQGEKVKLNHLKTLSDHIVSVWAHLQDLFAHHLCDLQHLLLALPPGRVLWWQVEVLLDNGQFMLL